MRQGMEATAARALLVITATLFAFLQTSPVWAGDYGTIHLSAIEPTLNADEDGQFSDSSADVDEFSPAPGGVQFGRFVSLVGNPIRRIPERKSTASGSLLSAVNWGGFPTTSPLRSSVVTSSFGVRRHPISGVRRMHRGIDLAAPMGSPVFATSQGVVSFAGWRNGYGLVVYVNHPGGVQTRYAHLSSLQVVAGQVLNSGSVVGQVGSTGNSTGPHLHYEVRKGADSLNPSLLEVRK